VPIDTFLQTWERLAKGDNWGSERPSRSTVGVAAIDTPEGCRLERVNEGGPAAEAGLRLGDIVLRVNNTPVTDADDFARRVRESKPGAELALLVKRDGEELPFKVKVEERRWRGRRPPDPDR
jgi:S1-C subfamily serine protease